ncbi:N-acetyltransferase [Rufibacter sp. LB8]|uniref:GNAT family N-acetyltransferase n=1 Tax=Rufibacter sp. LB8 TaxID=2777781 RepID=UPI00178C5C7E|nr:GNAT family N-acetyltransferase [Rufibacter sp. LB8]
MQIVNSTLDDFPEILRLYQAASAYQRAKNVVTWPDFDHQLILKEIQENHQWKLLDEHGQIICIWATTFSDPLIWEERDQDPAVYIHRIATNPDHRGKQLVQKIVAWAKEYAAQHKKKYVRLDTIGENKPLIQHYTACGFTFLGLFKLENTVGLPAHYENATVSLFEVEVE